VRLAIIVAIITGILTVLIFAEHLIDDSEEHRYLFVLSVTSGSLKGDTLTLNGVPNVIYFSDRTARNAGHMSLSNFVEMWDKGVDSFKADPPNATLSVLNKEGAKNVVVELMSVEQKNGSVVFKVAGQEAITPDSFKTSSLFVDEESLAVECDIF
jgi:hypothetical protein